MHVRPLKAGRSSGRVDGYLCALPDRVYRWVESFVASAFIFLAISVFIILIPKRGAEGSRHLKARYSLSLRHGEDESSAEQNRPLSSLPSCDSCEIMFTNSWTSLRGSQTQMVSLKESKLREPRRWQD